jgi:branched-chain amino acid transport system permease protein
MILGGASKIIGPIIGSIIFWFLATFLDSFLRNATASGIISPDLITGPDVGALRFVFVGLCLLLLMIFRPAGILGDPKELRLDVR